MQRVQGTVILTERKHNNVAKYATLAKYHPCKNAAKHYYLFDRDGTKCNNADITKTIKQIRYMTNVPGRPDIFAM